MTAKRTARLEDKSRKSSNTSKSGSTSKSGNTSKSGSTSKSDRNKTGNLKESTGTKNKATEADHRIECPNCAELIQPKALVCRFCNCGLSSEQFIACPFCAESIRKSATRCRNCRSPLPGILIGSSISRQRTKVRPDQSGRVNLQEVTFIKSIPGKDDSEGVVILNDGSLRQYIKCEGVNALLFDASGRENLARSFANFANSCESDVQIIVRSRALPVDEFLSRFQPKVKSENDYLTWFADYTDKWFRRMQDVHLVPQRDFYVVITHQPSAHTATLKKNKISKSPGQLEKANFQALDRLTRTAIEQLRSSSLRPAIMTKKEVRDLIYSQLNPALVQRESEAPPAVEGRSEAASLSASGLKIDDEYIWLDGRYINTQSLKHVPNVAWMGWLLDLLTVSVQFTLSMFIHPCNGAQFTPSSSQQSVQKPGHAVGDLVSKNLKNPPSENAHSSEKSFDISLYISTNAENAEQLAQQTDEIRRIFSNRGATLDRAQLFQLSAWQSTLCVAVNKFGAVHRVMSPTLATFWPFFTATCGTPNGTPFGFALASRQPVLLNPFFRGAGKEANNMLIVGSAGAGKSFAMSMLMLRLLPHGIRFVTIDKTIDKNSGYRFMTDLLGEELTAYIDLGSATGMTLNPFDIGSGDKLGKPSAEKISSLLHLFDLMLAPNEHEELSLQEKSTLDELIREAYKLSATDGKVPTMSDLFELTARAASDENEPSKREMLRRLARSISAYTKRGTYGSFLDGLTSFDCEKLLLVFDTREINEPRLERIAQTLVSEFIRRKAVDYRSRYVRFATVIDQSITWMRTKTGALLLDELSRQSRHTGMMFVCIAQQLKDFLGQASVADSVLKNAHMKLILRQDASDLGLLKEALNLSDAEVDSIQNFSKDDDERRDSQCLLLVGNIHGTVRLIPSPMDYWICTTEPTHDIPKRTEMLYEVKRKNHALNNADAARQCVYYLGIARDSEH
jgi:type IV secretory pathway VirB4 component